MKRVIIFWDQSNFQITLESLAKRDHKRIGYFDYSGFAKALQGQDDLIKVYFAYSAEDGDNRQEGFYKAVDYQPFISGRKFERKTTAMDSRMRSPAGQGKA